MSLMDRAHLPMALPMAHDTKVHAITVDFLVCPAMLRDTMDSASVCADQKDSVM